MLITEECLKVASELPKNSRSWFGDGSCVSNLLSRKVLGEKDTMNHLIIS